MLRSCSVIVACAGALLAPVSTEAAIHRVGSDAACTHATIQAAIDAATLAGGADEIRISAGTYADTALRISDEADPLRLVGGFASCAAPTPQPETWSTLFGTNGHPVLTIQDAADVTLVSLALGNAVTAYDGAGIYFGTQAGQLTLVDTIVSNNMAGTGGGILVGNTVADADPNDVRLILRGRSTVSSNLATSGDGGGIFCSHATLRLLDESQVIANNAESGDGGGIHANECRVEIASRGFPASQGPLHSNLAGQGHGGGLFLSGSRASAVVYPTDSLDPPRVRLNKARRGGAFAVRDGARLDIHDAWIAQNSAVLEGAAFWIADGGAEGLDTRVSLHRGVSGAPAGAVACAEPIREDCNRLRGNLALDPMGNPGSGTAAFVAATHPGQPSGKAHVRFEGTRIDDSTGNSLIAQTSSDGHVTLDGVLIVDNDVSGQLVVSLSPSSSLDIVATTIAANTLGSGSTVLFAPITCSSDSEARGTRVERSIVWQPGHALLTTFGGAPQSDCYRHLIGNDFTGLGPSAERVVDDPEFLFPAMGDYQLGPYSPALDFAPAHPADATRDGGPRVFDIAGYGNRFGPQDLGAYEYAPDDLLFANGFD